MVSMLTGQTDRRTQDHYITLSAKRSQRNTKEVQNTGVQSMLLKLGSNQFKFLETVPDDMNCKFEPGAGGRFHNCNSDSY